MIKVFMLSFLLTASAHALDTVELVQSVPLETTLSVPGVRDAQSTWIEMIGAAKSSLDIEQFYVSDQAGQALEPVLAAIKAASQRGVKVRLLVDLKFFSTYPDSVGVIGALPGAEARTIDYSKHNGVQHAKFFIVDGQASFVGSQNFDWRALSHIHEIGLKLNDAGISADLAKVFAKDWSEGAPLKGAPSPAPVTETIADDVRGKGPSLKLVASPSAENPKGISDSAAALKALIASAKHDVAVQVMEYTTRSSGKSATAKWSLLDDALRAAAARGVSVKLLVDVSDLKKAQKDLLSLAATKNIEVRSVTIPDWSGGKIDFARLIHSKYMVVDGATAWVGTENWSEGYFVNSRDVGIVFNDATPVKQLGQVFETVWSSTYAAPVK